MNDTIRAQYAHLSDDFIAAVQLAQKTTGEWTGSPQQRTNLDAGTYAGWLSRDGEIVLMVTLIEGGKGTIFQSDGTMVTAAPLDAARIYADTAAELNR